MDLIGDRTVAIVAEKVQFQDLLELDSPFVFRPRLELELLHEARLKILQRLGLALELLPHPQGRAQLILHEERELPQFPDSDTFSVVFQNLTRQEVHAVSLGIAFVETGEELCSANRHRHATLNEERDHAVMEHLRCALRNNLRFAALANKHTYVSKMLIDETPDVFGYRVRD